MIQIVRIDGNRITDWNTFHDVFAQEFGFPSFYGRNMNAWIDCMSYLGDPDAEMTQMHASPGEVIALVIDNCDSFKARCPEQFRALVECSAFVNWRLIEQGHPATLALTFYV